jgi:hypothetical protein
VTVADSIVLPTLTQIQIWRAEHLDAAADEWTRRADAWETAYSTVLQEVSQPGGTPWDGAAAQAAAQRVAGDRHAILGAADSLNTAAAIARSGAADIRIARQVVLDNVGSADHCRRFRRRRTSSTVIRVLVRTFGGVKATTSGAALTASIRQLMCRGSHR